MALPPSRPLVRRSKGERRVTFALKVLALIALSAVMLSAVLSFLERIPSVTVIVIGAVFFTYVIYPVVRFLHQRGAPLMAAIAITYLSIVALVAFGVAVVVPALADDTGNLVKSAPDYAHQAQTYLTDPDNPLIARVPPVVRDDLARIPAQAVAFAQDYAGTAASKLVGFVASIVGLIATIVVIPVLSVYLIFEAPEMIEALLRAFPEKTRPKALAIIHDLDRALGGFIRGQLTVGATIGVCITIALLILRVKYAVLIGVAAGLLDIIPYVGAIVGFVPSVSISLVTQGWQHAVYVAIVFALIFQAEGHFIAPRIVSDSVGLSPLMVIVAILIGGELGGIGGMFLAVPIAAIIRVIVLHAVPNLAPPAPPAPPAASIDQDAKAAGMPPKSRAQAKKAQRVRA